MLKGDVKKIMAVCNLRGIDYKEMMLKAGYGKKYISDTGGYINPSNRMTMRIADILKVPIERTMSEKETIEKYRITKPKKKPYVRITGRFKVCGVECINTAQFSEQFIMSEMQIDFERKNGLPHVKVWKRYLYPVGFCHRYFAGQTEGLDHAVRSWIGNVRKCMADEIDEEEWYISI